MYSYLAGVTIESLGNMFSAANEIMEWLGKVATLVAREVRLQHMHTFLIIPHRILIFSLFSVVFPGTCGVMDYAPRTSRHAALSQSGVSHGKNNDAEYDFDSRKRCAASVIVQTEKRFPA